MSRFSSPTVIDAENPITVSKSDDVDGTPNKGNAERYIKDKILASNQLQNAGYSVSSINEFDLTGVLELIPHTYDIDGSEDHSRMPANGVNECVDFLRAMCKFTVLVDGDTVEVSDIDLNLQNFDASNGIETYKVFNMSSLRLFMIEGDASGWSIYHRRYGHGVGMSQRGAQQRANDGQDYNDILSFYYPGTSLVTLDYTKTALTALTPPVDNSNAEVTCNDYLNVRSGPGTEFAVLGTLPDDARIEAISSANEDWYLINFGDYDAYVHKYYVIVEVTGISLNKETTSIYVGKNEILTAAVTPDTATDKSVSWSSSDENIATLSGGKVSAVAEGTATITVTTNDGSLTDTCEVTVKPTPQDEISSSVYTVDHANSWLLDVADETNITTLLNNLDNSPDDIKIIGLDDNEITDTFVLAGTGMKVQLVVNDTVIEEVEIVVLGDIDGNGMIDIIDYSYVKLHIFDVLTLEDLKFKAGDIDKNDVVDIIDYSYVKLDIFDVISIN